VEVGWLTVPKRRPEEIGDNAPARHRYYSELFTLQGQDAQDFIHKLRVKDVNSWPGWSGSGGGPVLEDCVGFRIHGQQDIVSLTVAQGWIAVAHGNTPPDHPWYGGSVPLKESTQIYLKELLKPYHIPDDVIDGKGR
jgi:hypothetical protein